MMSSTWVHYKTMRKKMGKCAVVKDFFSLSSTFLGIYLLTSYLLHSYSPQMWLDPYNVKNCIFQKKYQRTMIVP